MTNFFHFERIIQLLLLLSVIGCAVSTPYNIVGIDSRTENYDIDSPITVVCDDTFEKQNNSNVHNMILIEDIDTLGHYDMNYWYELAERNNYFGLIVAVTDHKLLGEAAYFYYENATDFDLLRYEILIEDFHAICDGNHTGEMLIDVTLSSNRWIAFYQGGLFFFCWGLVILVAFIVTIFTVLIMWKNWNDIALIFKCIIVLVLSSNIIRVFYAIVFIFSKIVPQAPHVRLYIVSELAGSFGTFNLSIIFTLLYIAFWQIIHNMSYDSLDSETKPYVLVVVSIDAVLFIVGIVLFVTAESTLVYYISYVYFILMYIFTVVYYAVTLRLVSKVLASIKNLKKETSSDKKKKNNISRLTNLLKLQLAILLAIAVLICFALYIVSPIQSSIVVCLQNILWSLFGLTAIYRQRKENTKSKSSTVKRAEESTQ